MIAQPRLTARNMATKRPISSQGTTSLESAMNRALVMVVPRSSRSQNTENTIRFAIFCEMTSGPMPCCSAAPIWRVKASPASPASTGGVYIRR